MKTTVNNIITGKQHTFVNNLSPKENLINTIILIKNQTSNLLTKTFREKIAIENKIVSKISANGDKIAFCYELNLFSRQKTN